MSSTTPTWVLLSVPTVTGVTAIIGATLTVWRSNRGAERRGDKAREDAWKAERRAAAAAVALSVSRLSGACLYYATRAVSGETGSALHGGTTDLLTACAELEGSIAAFRVIEDWSVVADQIAQMEDALPEIRAAVRQIGLANTGPADSAAFADPATTARLREQARELQDGQTAFVNTMRGLLSPDI